MPFDPNAPTEDKVVLPWFVPLALGEEAVHAERADLLEGRRFDVGEQGVEERHVGR